MHVGEQGWAGQMSRLTAMVRRRGMTPRTGLLKELATVSELVSRRWLIGAIAVTGVISGLTQAGFIVVLGRVAAALARNETPELFVLTGATPMFALATGLLIVVSLSLLTYAHLAALLLEEAAFELRSDLMTRFVHSTWEVQSEEQPGTLPETVNGHVNQISFAVAGLARLSMGLCNVATLFFVAFVVSPGTALLILVAVPPLFAVLWPVFRRIAHYARLRSRAIVELGAAVAETVQISRDIAVFGVHQQVDDTMHKRIRAVTEPAGKGLFYRSLAPQLFQVAVFSLVLLGLGLAWRSSDTNLEGVSITLVLFLRAMMHGREVQLSRSQLTDVQPFIEGFKQRRDRYQPTPVLERGTEVDSIQTIELRDCGYQYPQASNSPDGPRQQAISDISFTVSRGEAVGIIGPSGSGKSTLTEILLRLRPCIGDYLVNGAPAAHIASHCWTALVAYVPQRTTLLHASVADNIRFMRPEVSDADVTRAARMAQIHDEIERLPSGYDTALSGLSGHLSGGQAQRLCVARALVTSPELLILDEPTSALDATSASQLLDVLVGLKGTVTTFVVSHQVGAVNYCDKVLHLANGELVAVESASS